MARTDIFKSLCVSEYQDGQSQNGIGWKVLADYDTPRRGSQCRFSAVEPGDPYLPCKQGISVGEVGVFEWSETRKTPSGEMDVRPVKDADVYELIFPSEFVSVYLEDEDAVRDVLSKGFSVYSYTGNAYCNGQTHLVIFVPSRGNSRMAIVLHPDDRDKLDFNRQPANKPSPYFWTVKLVNKLEHKFVEKLDIIQMDNLPDIPYVYSGARDTTQPRRFLEMAPKVTGFMLPYSPKDFVSVFLRRELENIRKTQVLSSGRKLTKSDVREVLGLLESAIKNADTVKERIAVEDDSVVKCLMSGMESLLPSLRADMLQDSELSKNVKDLLFTDDDIYAHCLDAGRDMWLKDHEADVQAKQEELQKVESEIAATEERRTALEGACNDLRKQLQDLSLERERKESVIQDVNDGLHSAIETYRSDLSMLIAEMGCSVGPMPYAISGRIIPDVISAPDALTHNLKQFLAPESAEAVAIYLRTAVEAGYQIAVPGEMAKLIADALSAAQDGLTAGTLACVDKASEFSIMRSAVMSMNSSVVLIEGLLACEPDNKTLALTRHCPGKILVFSIDDSLNQDKISPSVFKRVAMLDGLCFAAGESASMKQLDTPLAQPAVFNPSTDVWSTGGELAERQRELMGC